MKKAFSVLLALALALSLGASSLAEAETHTYLATAYWGPNFLEDYGLEGDVSRAILAGIVGMQISAVNLPDDAPDGEAFIATGVRMTFAEPVTEIVHDTPLTPLSVEIVGELRYGIITEMGEDYIIHDTHDPDDTPQRFTLTADTLQSYEEAFAAGSGCEIIVDENGVVLAMIEGNG